MQKLFSFKHCVHLDVGTPPHYHGFTHLASFWHPTLRVSYKTKVSCKLFSDDYGEFRSTRVLFRRHNVLFNQPISYHRRRKLYSTRCHYAHGMVKGLILANVVVFLLWKVVDRKFMNENFTVQRDNISSGRYHTMITSSFSHMEVTHIIYNMLYLYFHGKAIEELLGPECLLIVYLSGAFVGSASFLVHRAFVTTSSKNNLTLVVENNRITLLDPSEARALGASDAVIAIMMLDTLLTPLDKIPVMFVGPVRLLMIFTVVFEEGVMGASLISDRKVSPVGISRIWEDIKRIKKDGKVAWSSHLGGAAVGVIAWAWLRKGRL